MNILELSELVKPLLSRRDRELLIAACGDRLGDAELVAAFGDDAPLRLFQIVAAIRELKRRFEDLEKNREASRC